MQVSAGAIVRQDGKLLIVKPAYRDYWLLPGGHVEDGESPRDALTRELKEELSLQMQIGRLLSVDFCRKGWEARHEGRAYVQPHGALVLLFDGGELPVGNEKQISLPRLELQDAKFREIEDALHLLAPYYAGRVTSALKALITGKVVYLENGSPLDDGT